ncbi:Phosphatidylinositol 4-kinase gamma 4 [Hibiscus syriacus]|uniref:1-phosphatidylinositol 4-kinase n=1 Tax=Hibiscus syriacus TaxID=106335 RepID=A0A6A3C4G5_HIBSY|nr:phosphatidylinositol 4-kinase gamma 4-like [Hibiscus syriacus]KAE8722112.1 Phosphatidylinositol 4-kinase gamma 4 [Hibiscus syriacus]
MSSAGLDVVTIRNEPLTPSSHLNLKLDHCDNESIRVYLAFSGSMIPMRIMESDSIESLKLRIQTCKGFVVKNQKLVCGGRELARSNSLVRDYGVNDGNVLHLVLRLSDLQVINVKTCSGKEFTFRVRRGRGYDVNYVKRQVAKREKGFTNLDDQEVVFDGEQLEDQRLIDDICKHNDAVLNLLVQKSAKVRVKPFAKNFELSIVAPELKDKRVNDVGVTDDRVKYDFCGGENYSRGYEVERHVVPRKTPDRDFILEPVIVNPKVELPSVIVEMINSTFDGLDSGRSPIRSTEGTGGAYFMQDLSGQKFVAVFKPIDEEPLAVNNPRELPMSSDGEGLKKGTRVGEGAFREVAAYILDHPKNKRRTIYGDEKGFAGVPPTAMVKCLHNGFNNPNGSPKVKIGSLQMFVENSGSCEDMGPRSFSVDQVHKISVLDIRLANADRHAGNILLGKDEDGQTLLIPIDHGYCLPESFEDCTFDWLYWPQARQAYSPEIVDYIKSLDAEKDIALLKYLGWDMPPKCARTLHISTMILKKGAAKALTPFVIGSIMCRENLNGESMIEQIVQEAEDHVGPNASEAAFLKKLSQIMDHRLDEIAGSS